MAAGYRSATPFLDSTATATGAGVAAAQPTAIRGPDLLSTAQSQAGCTTYGTTSLKRPLAGQTLATPDPEQRRPPSSTTRWPSCAGKVLTDDTAAQGGANGTAAESATRSGRARPLGLLSITTSPQLYQVYRTPGSLSRLHTQAVGMLQPSGSSARVDKPMVGSAQEKLLLDRQNGGAQSPKIEGKQPSRQHAGQAELQHPTASGQVQRHSAGHLRPPRHTLTSTQQERAALQLQATLLDREAEARAGSSKGLEGAAERDADRDQHGRARRLNKPHMKHSRTAGQQITGASVAARQQSTSTRVEAGQRKPVQLRQAPADPQAGRHAGRQPTWTRQLHQHSQRRGKLQNGPTELTAGQDGSVVAGVSPVKGALSRADVFAGQSNTGMLLHSWESHDDLAGQDPPEVEAPGQPTAAADTGAETLWLALWQQCSSWRAAGGQSLSQAIHLQDYKRCNPWRWVHWHTTGFSSNSAPDDEPQSAPAVAPGRPGGHASHESKQKLLVHPDVMVDLERLPASGLFTGRARSSRRQSRVLVVYHYHESASKCHEDEEVLLTRSNLLFFLRTAVREADGADYVFNFGGRLDPELLALVPPYDNVAVRFVDAETMHSDTCTFHKTLLEVGPKLFRYHYYVLINNAMRGPFVAAGSPAADLHWSEPYIAKLSKQVKLVGTYISCEVATHVQGPFLVTDRVGVQYVLDTFGGCWLDHWTSILQSEIGLSQAILAAGYNVASLQPEYAGIDFSVEPRRLACRGKLNPNFCCGLYDPQVLHWTKYGGEAYRQGFILPNTIRMVEHFTAEALAMTSGLVPNAKHALPSRGWLDLRDTQARAMRARHASLWARTARLFSAVFRSIGVNHSGYGLMGMQQPGMARYLGQLDNESLHEFRFSLDPHISGFESAESDQEGHT